MYRKFIHLNILVLSFLAIGCASRKEIVAFKNDALYMRNELDAIRQENAEFDRQLKEINGCLQRH
ncbi:hypothetical protein JW998_16125 [candidate division KSB1 bacterium]|nr:hypothetical protein [candidate division KSB1 bacterium]